MTVGYRPAEPADAECITAVYRLTRAACLPYLPVLHTVAEETRYFRKLVASGAVRVAVADGAIVGFCAIRPGWVDHLYVLPEHGGTGIGSALLRTAMDANRELRLWVFQKNVRAIRFYESAGFGLIERTDGRDNEEREPDALYGWLRPT